MQIVKAKVGQGCRGGWTAEEGRERTDSEEECLLCPLDAASVAIDSSLGPVGEAIGVVYEEGKVSGMPILETKDA